LHETVPDFDPRSPYSAIGSPSANDEDGQLISSGVSRFSTWSSSWPARCAITPRTRVPRPNQRMDTAGARPSLCDGAGTAGRLGVTFSDRAASPQLMRGR
jgi:hypothetical protein